MADRNDGIGALLVSGRPNRCSKCGGELNYRGLGQYVCSECNNVDMDDYGKVRAYLEEYPGANQRDVAIGTGVPANRIRQLLLEDRIEISAQSSIFLFCESCGKPIRSGLRCGECEKKYEAKLAQEKKMNRTSALTGGHAAGRENASGEMRFVKK